MKNLKIKKPRCTVNYRKIYESYYGSIPIDSLGRTYEIHHIDGNHFNNEISNLKAVTILEHYEIHRSQGDYAAALAIARRMDQPPDSEQLSKIASESNKQRLETGTHHWKTKQHSEMTRKRNLERVANGTHPTQQQTEKDRVKN